MIDVIDALSPKITNDKDELGKYKARSVLSITDKKIEKTITATYENVEYYGDKSVEADLRAHGIEIPPYEDGEKTGYREITTEILEIKDGKLISKLKRQYYHRPKGGRKWIPDQTSEHAVANTIDTEKPYFIVSKTPRTNEELYKHRRNIPDELRYISTKEEEKLFRLLQSKALQTKYVKDLSNPDESKISEKVINLQTIRQNSCGEFFKRPPKP